MVKRIVKFFAVFLLLLSADCDWTRRRPAQTIEQQSNSIRIDTADGMAEYLQKQHLPAVKAIEIWPSFPSTSPRLNRGLSNHFGKGLKITTEHYEIYTTLFEPLVLRNMPAFLESCYQGYQQLLPASVETKAPFVVYLFANRTQWEFFTLGYMGEQGPLYIKIKAGAYYLNGSCAAYYLGTDRTFRALGHECWHQFADRIFKFRLPSWLNEGIAMQFEANEHKGGFFYFTPGRNHYRLVKLKQALINEQTIPLKDLINNSPGEMMENSNDGAVTTFYSQCYALIRFLYEADGGRYLPGLKRMLADGLTGNWPIKIDEQYIAIDRRIPLTVGWNKNVAIELFEHYVSNDLEKIEQQYLDFCGRATNKIRIKQIADKQ